MKKNKGFTLVEVIVILVILAILAAVLIPSLTTYIDKAREKSITANARAAYVATQALASENYGLGVENEDDGAEPALADIKKLAQLDDITFTITVAFGTDNENGNFEADSDGFDFQYTQTDDNKVAKHNATTGAWVVEDAG